MRSSFKKLQKQAQNLKADTYNLALPSEKLKEQQTSKQSCDDRIGKETHLRIKVLGHLKNRNILDGDTVEWGADPRDAFMCQVATHSEAATSNRCSLSSECLPEVTWGRDTSVFLFPVTLWEGAVFILL